MALNLIKNNFQVIGHDNYAPKKEELISKGVQMVENISQINVPQVVVTMLPNAKIVKSVCESQNGLFKTLKPDSIIIDSSTISPLDARELHKKAKDHGIFYVDAPVSGGVTGATAGTLTFMLGSSDPIKNNRIETVLKAMGKNIFICGEIGTGQIAKICNNMALAVQMISVAEALNLGIKMGMDSKTLSNIMKVSTSRCWSVDTYNPVPGVLENVPASRDYEGGFSCELITKDLGIADEICKNIGVKSPFGQESLNVYKRLVEEGLGKKDFGVIYEALMKGKI